MDSVAWAQTESKFTRSAIETPAVIGYLESKKRDDSSSQKGPDAFIPVLRTIGTCTKGVARTKADIISVENDLPGFKSRPCKTLMFLSTNSKTGSRHSFTCNRSASLNKTLRDTLGISDQRLMMLIREGVIEGEIHLSRAGRKFVMVRRDQLDLARDAVHGFIDMKTAGGLLGLTKKRMRQILRYLFPEARKTGAAASTPWSVSRNAVESLLATSNGLAKISIPDEGCVSIGHILRYWAWTADEIVSLIRAACSKEVEVINLLDGNVGISAWIFQETTLKAWKAKSTMGYGTWLTVPQMAKVLSIKEQVAYDIVKGNFINGETMHKQPRGGIRVNRTEVEKFKQKFVFCTEIAQQLGVSSLKAKSILAGFYINPISGPGIDNARQLLYFRNDELKYALKNFVSEKDKEFRLI